MWWKRPDRQSGFSLARQAIRPRGTLVMKSTYKGEMNVNFSSIVVDEINIVGSRCGPFEPALRLMEARQVDPTVLIADEFKLGNALKHLSTRQRQACSKCCFNRNHGIGQLAGGQSQFADSSILY